MADLDEASRFPMDELKPKWRDLDGRGCDRENCWAFGGKQTVLSAKEAKAVFFSKEMQRDVFDAPIETLESKGVTHVCQQCGAWYWGMTDEARAHREREFATA